MKYHFIAAAALLIAPIAFADNAVINKHPLNGIAIGGHDVLGYRTDENNTPTMGQELHEVEHKGAVWRFASKEHAEQFSAAPETFEPAYGGYCANALALGEGLIPTSGRHYAIFDERLYLFFAPRGSKRWLSGDWKQYKREADAAWVEETGG